MNGSPKDDENRAGDAARHAGAGGPANEAAAKRLLQQGLDALKRGQAKTALPLLADAARAGVETRDSLLALAVAARANDAPEESRKAAEKLLTLEPENAQALLLKGDALAATGDARRAAAAYRAALARIPASAQLPPAFAKAVDRARDFCADAAKTYEETIRERLKSSGILGAARTSSAQTRKKAHEQALDIMFGRQQIHHQAPLKFYFPELPQKAFYEPSEFSWTKDVIAQADEIRAELAAILEDKTRFEPYVPADARGGHVTDPRISGNADWGAFHLYREGAPQPENLTRCPATAVALKCAPQPVIAGKSPVALFSQLKPGMHIPPHHGMMNTRLICHLSLIAPTGCTLRVGGEVREWRKDEMLIFDDSFEHEATNAGEANRIVLLFDIWRPELTEEDRAFVNIVIESMDDFSDN